MDINTKKVLKAINKYHDEVDIDLILNKVNLPKDDFLEILYDLEKEYYIRITSRNNIETTNKGKTYWSSSILNWLSEHIIESLALLISIIAMIESTIALLQ